MLNPLPPFTKYATIGEEDFAQYAQRVAKILPSRFQYHEYDQPATYQWSLEDKLHRNELFNTHNQLHFLIDLIEEFDCLQVYDYETDFHSPHARNGENVITYEYSLGEWTTKPSSLCEAMWRCLVEKLEGHTEMDLLFAVDSHQIPRE